MLTLAAIGIVAMTVGAVGVVAICALLVVAANVGGEE